ncbi:basic salivary proline-rich protein 3-like [Candoia aspera]|uniref:basic salivary proline-rich protein 3-like n=1 Tax=Candoia aspera TaxID=51853 RepID=UPI002FD7DEB6
MIRGHVLVRFPLHFLHHPPTHPPTQGSPRPTAPHHTPQSRHDHQGPARAAVPSRARRSGGSPLRRPLPGQPRCRGPGARKTPGPPPLAASRSRREPPKPRCRGSSGTAETLRPPLHAVEAAASPGSGPLSSPHQPAGRRVPGDLPTPAAARRSPPVQAPKSRRGRPTNPSPGYLN